jgi:hypothetical protein
MAEQPKAKGTRNQIQEWTAIPAPYLKRCGRPTRRPKIRTTRTIAISTRSRSGAGMGRIEELLFAGNNLAKGQRPSSALSRSDHGVPADNQVAKSRVAGAASGMRSTPSPKGGIPTTRPDNIRSWDRQSWAWLRSSPSAWLVVCLQPACVESSCNVNPPQLKLAI